MNRINHQLQLNHAQPKKNVISDHATRKRLDRWPSNRSRLVQVDNKCWLIRNLIIPTDQVVCAANSQFTSSKHGIYGLVADVLSLSRVRLLTFRSMLTAFHSQRNDDASLWLFTFRLMTICFHWSASEVCPCRSLLESSTILSSSLSRCTWRWQRREQFQSFNHRAARPTCTTSAIRSTFERSINKLKFPSFFPSRKTRFVAAYLTKPNEWKK